MSFRLSVCLSVCLSILQVGQQKAEQAVVEAWEDFEQASDKMIDFKSRLVDTAIQENAIQEAVDKSRVDWDEAVSQVARIKEHYYTPVLPNESV